MDDAAVVAGLVPVPVGLFFDVDEFQVRIAQRAVRATSPSPTMPPPTTAMSYIIRRVFCPTKASPATYCAVAAPHCAIRPAQP